MSQQDDMTDTSSYTIDDLASETGFDRRVIRSFIEQGLLRGPDSMGRYARYSKSHLDRLLAIKALKNIQGMPLHEVRRALLSMSQQDIQALAVSSLAENIIYPPPPVVGRVEESESPSSALDYIRSIEEKAAEKKSPPQNIWGFQAKQPQPNAQQPVAYHKQIQKHLLKPLPQQLLPAEPKVTPLDRLLLNLTALAGTTKPRRQAKSDSWHRIPVTPDIELTVRGNLSDDDLNKLERIADCLREILMGGQ